MKLYLLILLLGTIAVFAQASASRRQPKAN